MDETVKEALSQISTRYPDDGDQIWTQRVGWQSWVTDDDRAEFEARRAALRQEVQTAYAQSGVEGVRVLAGRVVYVWTDASVEAIQAAADKAGDEKLSEICERYFTEEDREVLSDGEREALWKFLDELAEED